MASKMPTVRPALLNDGKEFESIVAAIHRQFANGAVVTENEKIVGKSGRVRQVDVAVRTSVMGYKVFILIECKDYKKKIGIDKVDELIGKIEDVGAEKGVLVSNSGFTKDALERAKKDGRIQLSSVIDIKNKKIRAKLAIPFLAHFDSPQTLQLRVDMGGDASMRWDFVEEEKLKFRRLWNEGKLDASPGNHEYQDVVRDDATGRLIVTMIYTIKRTSYYKKVPLEESVGIYNHNDEGYTTKQIVTVPIRMDDFGSWEVVEGELPQATMQIFGQEAYAELEERGE